MRAKGEKMLLKIFAVKDRATDAYATPMFLISEGQAIRMFTDEVNRAGTDNPIFNHPDDYDLHHLGEYETNTGVITPQTPTQILLGKQVKIRS